MPVVAEEAAARDLLLVFEVVVHPVREDHVVDPLERIPRDPRIILDQFEVVLKRALPIEFLVFLRTLQVRHGAENIYGICLVLHTFHLGFYRPKKRIGNETEAGRGHRTIPITGFSKRKTISVA
jgi:hypothetical protein